MKRFFYRKASLLSLLMGCWLLLLLAACGPAATTGSGTPTPTKVTTPVATQSTPAAKLMLTFACKGGFTPSGTHEYVCVRTLPGASLTIHVTYCTGSVDQSPALTGTFTADNTGSHQWSWTPKANCQGNPPGATGFWKGTAQVTATLGGQHVASSLDFGV
ncbi:MAG TPA: hypothetical protein VJ761_09535 [Ktedonobacteraceae bacterium]|nr:hypothetical protein [Ktedonobacteraceae bacterium]